MQDRIYVDDYEVFDHLGVSQIKVPEVRPFHMKLLHERYDHTLIIDGYSITTVLSETNAIIWAPAKGQLPKNSFLQAYFVADTSHLYKTNFNPSYDDVQHAIPKLMFAMHSFKQPLESLSFLLDRQLVIDLQTPDTKMLVDLPAAMIFSQALEQATDKVLYFRIRTHSPRYSIFLELGHSHGTVKTNKFRCNRIIFDNDLGQIVHKQWSIYHDSFKAIMMSIIERLDIIDIYTLEGFYRALSVLTRTNDGPSDVFMDPLTDYPLAIDYTLLDNNDLRGQNSRYRHQSTWTR